ncbi:MAG: hypothetical protein WC303_00685 [Candidatus Paceibacterota bacterium]|jgi:hypothetical protein
MKNNNMNSGNNVNIAEIILVVLIGIFISAVFFVEMSNVSSRINKMEEQYQAMESEIVNLRIKINSEINKNSLKDSVTENQTTVTE